MSYGKVCHVFWLEAEINISVEMSTRKLLGETKKGSDCA
jgi:hypothetical protein